MSKDEFYFWDEMWNQNKQNNENEESVTKNSMENEES